MDITTCLEESYGERLSRREAYIAVMDQGTVLFVPRGVSQAAACDGNYYQILVEGDKSNPHPEFSQFELYGSSVHAATTKPNNILIQEL